MEIKAILLDFDGTSLQKDQVYLSLRNMWALRQAMDRGVQIIPCTGRVEDMLPPQIEAEPRIRYWVTSGGEPGGGSSDGRGPVQPHLDAGAERGALPYL